MLPKNRNFTMLAKNRKWCHDLKIAYGVKLPVSSALSSSFNFSRSTSGCSDTGIGINISSAEHCPVIKQYSQACLKRPLKKKTKIVFQDQLLLNAGQKYCRMLQESILQYFRPALSYHLSLRPLFFSNFKWPLNTGLTVLRLDCGQIESRVWSQLLSAAHHKVTWSILIEFKYSTA